MLLPPPWELGRESGHPLTPTPRSPCSQGFFCPYGETGDVRAEQTDPARGTWHGSAQNYRGVVEGLLEMKGSLQDRPAQIREIFLITQAKNIGHFRANGEMVIHKDIHTQTELGTQVREAL